MEFLYYCFKGTFWVLWLFVGCGLRGGARLCGVKISGSPLLGSCREVCFYVLFAVPVI